MANQELFDLSVLSAFTTNPVSGQIDDLFKKVIKEKTKVISKSELNNFSEVEKLSNEMESEINLSIDENPSQTPEDSNLFEDGFELDIIENENINILKDSEQTVSPDNTGDIFGDISIPTDDLEDLDLSFSESEELSSVKESSVIEELDFRQIDEDSKVKVEEKSLTLDNNENDIENIPDLGELGSSVDVYSNDIDFLFDEDSSDITESSVSKKTEDNEMSFSPVIDQYQDEDLSEDARKKLEEIDEILVEDATRLKLNKNLSDEVNQEKKIDIKSKIPEAKGSVAILDSVQKKVAIDLKEIASSYSGDIERIQATISNLRTDREELLLKIQKLEEEKILQSRQILTQRAEIDEKRIELTIIRKKLNEEIISLKDINLINEEKRMILEEKNRILQVEADKAKQKNKIDVKNIQLREKELEQRLELLKSDAETQIKSRDLKILELKRKIDAMEFDMESITTIEKKSIESRFELENKLEKAIKTLRDAISSLEGENSHSEALNALKKNIDA